MGFGWGACDVGLMGDTQVPRLALLARDDPAFAELGVRAALEWGGVCLGAFDGGAMRDTQVLRLALLARDDPSLFYSLRSPGIACSCGVRVGGGCKTKPLQLWAERVGKEWSGLEDDFRTFVMPGVGSGR